jgi:hypothetical protein
MAEKKYFSGLTKKHIPSDSSWAKKNRDLIITLRQTLGVSLFL